ncbi:hypothetical protein J437_LFUL019212, partial [Ladona fulva]
MCKFARYSCRFLPAILAGRAENYQSSRIPGVIGYVDGTHMAIKAPKDEENLFLNRKSYHSMNVMT